MKKRSLLLVFFCGMLLLSFSNKKEESVEINSMKIEIPLDKSIEGWGSWNTTDCLRGLDFRVRNDGYNKYAKKYRWSIEFKNRYKESLHFSYKAVAPNQKYEIRRSGKTTDRIHVNSGGKRGSYYLVNSSSSIYIYVNRIRIHHKDYGVKYYKCDK